MRRLAVALLHFPVLDRAGMTVTTAVTNLDVHDIARSAFTYGVTDYFIVHPITAQQQLVERICEHWLRGSGGKRIPDRVKPMGIVRVVPSLDEALARFGEGEEVELWSTSASADPTRFPLAEARRALMGEGPRVLLCFGTGWGLTKQVHQRAKHRLEPIASPRADGYNHLSVRAAAAIFFDRLCGGER